MKRMSNTVDLTQNENEVSFEGTAIAALSVCNSGTSMKWQNQFPSPGDGQG
jgi:hypothetical protein